MAKKVLFEDMDGVIVDFDSARPKISADLIKANGKVANIPGIFSLMDPMPGAIKSIKSLAQFYDVFIASTMPWHNDSAATDKIKWIKKYFGDSENDVLYKKIILTHYKDQLIGDILIDDRTKNGASEFRGELILFGDKKFPDWSSVLRHLL